MRKVIAIAAAVLSTLSVNVYANTIDLNIVSNAYVDLMAKGNYMDGPVSQSQRMKIIQEAHTLNEDKHTALESFVSDVANTGKSTGPEDTCHRASIIVAMLSTGSKGPNNWTTVDAAGFSSNPNWTPSIRYIKSHPDFANALYEAFGTFNDGYYASDLAHQEEMCVSDLEHK